MNILVILPHSIYNNILLFPFLAKLKKKNNNIHIALDCLLCNDEIYKYNNNINSINYIIDYVNIKNEINYLKIKLNIDKIIDLQKINNINFNKIKDKIIYDYDIDYAKFIIDNIIKLPKKFIFTNSKINKYKYKYKYLPVININDMYLKNIPLFVKVHIMRLSNYIFLVKDHMYLISKIYNLKVNQVKYNKI